MIEKDETLNQRSKSRDINQRLIDEKEDTQGSWIDSVQKKGNSKKQDRKNKLNKDLQIKDFDKTKNPKTLPATNNIKHNKLKSS
jgi:hypothetical protein